jgi:hypothetical protein
MAGAIVLGLHLVKQTKKPVRKKEGIFSDV